MRDRPDSFPESLSGGGGGHLILKEISSFLFVLAYRRQDNLDLSVSA